MILEKGINMNDYIDRVKNIIPGMVLAFVVALISKVISIYLSNIGPATISILLGILLGNTLCRKSVFNRGTKIAESKLLEISVVLLGITVSVQTIVHVGYKGIIFILLQMSFTILIVYNLGKKLRLTKNMSLLMAGGNAVCGSSAIASISPVIKANEFEKGQIITLVNLLGTVMMFIVPLVGGLLYKDNIFLKSALVGGTLQSVGQVVASASMISSEAVELSMLFKIIRIMLLAIVVYIFGKMKESDNKLDDTKRKFKFPWYIIGFVVLCFISSIFILPKSIGGSASFISGWFEITALAAIGLRLDFKKFFREGKKFLIYGLLVGVCQIFLAVIFLRIL